MIGPPAITSLQEQISHRGDVEFWWPYLREILRRHGLLDGGRAPVTGHNATYPTFVYGDVVVKLFGHYAFWRAGYAAERAAYVRLATDPEIAAPRLLGAGPLSGDDDSWCYLLTSRMPGVESWRAELSAEQWRALAADVGRQVRRLQALPPVGVPTFEEWSPPDATTAAARSSLPPNLVAQVEAYLARLGPLDRTVVHGDLTQNHIYVEDGRFVGIIDWGDLLAGDRHLELIQVYRDLLDCDKALFRIFLEACGWPIDDAFPHRALGMALQRQAVGLAQHSSIDVFMPIAAKYPLQEIGTLDELAALLFEF